MNGVHCHENHLTPAPTANKILFTTNSLTANFIRTPIFVYTTRHLIYTHDNTTHSLIIVNAIAHCHCLHFPIKTNFFLIRPSRFFCVFAVVPSISIIKHNQNARTLPFTHPLRGGTFAASVANSHCIRSLNVRHTPAVCVENGFEWKWKMKMGISAINPIEIGEKYRDSFEQS